MATYAGRLHLDSSSETRTKPLGTGPHPTHNWHYIVLMNATYTCNQCDMAVKASCAKCDVPLENGHLELPNGSSVQVSKCPSCEGKIKSPQCCGSDMSCAA